YRADCAQWVQYPVQPVCGHLHPHVSQRHLGAGGDADAAQAATAAAAEPAAGADAGAAAAVGSAAVWDAGKDVPVAAGAAAAPVYRVSGGRAVQRVPDVLCRRGRAVVRRQQGCQLQGGDGGDDVLQPAVCFCAGAGLRPPAPGHLHQRQPRAALRAAVPPRGPGDRAGARHAAADHKQLRVDGRRPRVGPEPVRVLPHAPDRGPRRRAGRGPRPGRDEEGAGSHVGHRVCRRDADCRVLRGGGRLGGHPAGAQAHRAEAPWKGAEPDRGAGDAAARVPAHGRAGGPANAAVPGDDLCWPCARGHLRHGDAVARATPDAGKHGAGCRRHARRQGPRPPVPGVPRNAGHGGRYHAAVPAAGAADPTDAAHDVPAAPRRAQPSGHNKVPAQTADIGALAVGPPAADCAQPRRAHSGVVPDAAGL
ncbi:hypothetical protein H4R21_006100, partial [Coemansia helicoidea]